MTFWQKLEKTSDVIIDAFADEKEQGYFADTRAFTGKDYKRIAAEVDKVKPWLTPTFRVLKFLNDWFLALFGICVFAFKLDGLVFCLSALILVGINFHLQKSSRIVSMKTANLLRLSCRSDDVPRGLTKHFKQRIQRALRDCLIILAVLLLSSQLGLLKDEMGLILIYATFILACMYLPPTVFIAKHTFRKRIAKSRMQELAIGNSRISLIFITLSLFLPLRVVLVIKFTIMTILMGGAGVFLMLGTADALTKESIDIFQRFYIFPLFFAFTALIAVGSRAMLFDDILTYKLIKISEYLESKQKAA